MINIGIIRFNSGNYGGIEHQIINIISYLKDDNFRFTLITNKETQFSSIFKKYGDVKLINSSNIWKASKEVKEIVEKNSISIIQSHMLKEHYIGALTKLRLKKLYHIFRVHTYINCSFISDLKKKLYHLLSFLLKSKVDLYLPINQVNEKELIKFSKVNKKKIMVIHDGVKSLKDYKTSNTFDYYRIAMIANLNYGKGHDIALKALQLLVKKDKNYHLYFIGYERTKSPNGVSITEETKKLVKELGLEENVSFLGYKEDVGKEIQDIDIVILPSYSEGTPNCLLEAMSVKKVVIASAVGGVPEFIKDGVNGFLHENKDYETLANKILDLKNMKEEEIEKIRENGYKMWKEEYTVDNMCRNLRNIYQEKGENAK